MERFLKIYNYLKKYTDEPYTKLYDAYSSEGSFERTLEGLVVSCE